MNIENLTLLAEKLEQLPPDKFSMRHWECGSVACIGGWTDRWFPETKDAYEALGLDGPCVWTGTGRQLFYPSTTICPELRASGIKDAYGSYPENALYRRIWNEDQDLPPADAAKVVRNLIATGKVDWSVLL